MKQPYSDFVAKYLRRGLRSAFVMATFAFATDANAQLTYTFTTAGATGTVGPTQTQVNNAYTGTNLQGSVVATGGIQSFTIPVSGPYKITAYGAQGGYNGGYGAIIAGGFTFTAGQVIKILVGQQGIQGTNSAPYSAGGGGGGTFIADNANTPLIVAGGGGGNGDGYSGVPVGCCLNGMQAAVNTAGNPYPSGSNGGTGGGGGGCSGTNAGGGAGFYGNGSQCQSGSAALSFTNGGTGGQGFLYGGTYAHGGFGGGGGHYDSGTGMRGGGGGGYSGGGGGTANTGNDAAGGGGGSYNSGSSPSSSVTNLGNGKVLIEQICNMTLLSSVGNSVAPAICNGNSTTLTVNGVSNYSWSTGATTNSIVVSPNTTTVYNVAATTSAACTAYKSITVTVSAGLPVLSITNPTTSLCLGKSTTLTATGALSHTWTGGITNAQSFTPTTSQVYTVTGTNGCGNTTATTAVNVAPLPVNLTASPAIVCQGYPSTLTAVSAVTGYTWSPASPNASLIVITPTSNIVYTVTASDGTCTGSSTVGITTKVTPTITTTSSQSVFCDGGSAILSASGASTYVWSPGNLPGNTVTVSPNVSTPFQVFGTNSVGCVGVANVVIIVNPNPTITATTNKTLVCENSPAVLNSNGASTYTWTGGTPGSQTYSVNPATTTEYTVTGTGQNGCTDKKMVTVNVYLPVLNIAATPSAVCPGGQINLVASTHQGSNFKWNGNNSSASIQLTPASTTVYVASANSNSNSVICPATNSILVTVHNNPTVTVTADKTVLCRNEKAPVITAAGASSYAWNTSAATTNTIAAANNISNSYIATGTDVNGCKGTAAISITVNACTGLAEATANAETIQIYPNPSKGTFVVSTTQDVTLSIISELGQVIRTVKLSADNNHTVSVDNLPAGIYFAVGETSTTRINQKIVIAN